MTLFVTDCLHNPWSGQEITVCSKMEKDEGMLAAWAAALVDGDFGKAGALRDATTEVLIVMGISRRGAALILKALKVDVSRGRVDCG